MARLYEGRAAEEAAMAIAPPTYTQVPNEIIDLLPQMALAESRVVLALCRQTFGWHRREAIIPLSDFEAMTGLSRQGVLNGLEAGMARGLIVRIADGSSYRYSLMIEGYDEDEPSQRSRPARHRDQSTSLTPASQRSRPAKHQDRSTSLTPASQRSRPQPVNEVDHVREVKENEIKIKETTTIPPPKSRKPTAPEVGDGGGGGDQETIDFLWAQGIATANQFGDIPLAAVKPFVLSLKRQGAAPRHIVGQLRRNRARLQRQAAAPPPQASPPDTGRPDWIDPTVWAELPPDMHKFLEGSTLAAGQLQPANALCARYLHERYAHRVAALEASAGRRAA